MAHLDMTLPEEVELGARRRLAFKTEIVTTDGGREVRNARWASPLRSFDISFPTAERNDPVYLAVLHLYEISLGGLHTFNFSDWTDDTGGTLVKVRFDTPLEIEGVDHELDHIVQLSIVEVR